MTSRLPARGTNITSDRFASLVPSFCSQHILDQTTDEKHSVFPSLKTSLKSPMCINYTSLLINVQAQWHSPTKTLHPRAPRTVIYKAYSVLGSLRGNIHHAGVCRSTFLYSYMCIEPTFKYVQRASSPTGNTRQKKKTCRTHVNIFIQNPRIYHA